MVRPARSSASRKPSSDRKYGLLVSSESSARHPDSNWSKGLHCEGASEVTLAALQGAVLSLLCLLRLSDEPLQVSILLPIIEASSKSGGCGLDLLLQATPSTGSEDDWLALAVALIKKLLMVLEPAAVPLPAGSPFLIAVAVAAMEMEWTRVVMSGL